MRILVSAVCAILAFGSAAATLPIAAADPVHGQPETLRIHSPSMGKDIAVQVIRAADNSVPRPVLYLLNGAGGGEDTRTWLDRTDAATFFADKNVNVVIPVGGAFSYYTDWVDDDPVLGRNKWATFLARELPPAINETLKTNGANAIAGISMAGGSVLALAESNPGLYKAVGSYSGCAETSTPIGKQFVRMVVEDRGGAKVSNMWGRDTDPAWAANDPYLHAERLRGMAVYISAGSGLPGPHDAFDSQQVNGNPVVLADQLVVGGLIEAAVNACTRRLVARLQELNIPAVADLRPTGSHSWAYWQDDLHKSWPMMAEALTR